MSENKNAAIYVRCSTSPSTSNNLSCTSQFEACYQYAKKHDYRVMEIIVDTDISSKVAFPKLIDKVVRDKRNIRTLICYQTDRVSRSFTQNESVMKQLMNKKIMVRIVTNECEVSPIGIEPKTPHGTLIRDVSLSLARFENEIKAERVKDAMKSKFQQGYWLWQAPFGYKLSDQPGLLILDGKEAELVEDIFYEVEYQKYLLEQNLQKKFGMSISKIKKILSNPFYKGEMYTKTWDMKIKGKHKPIVDEKTWSEAQL